jgi:uncharacterized protein (TIGR02246 family)
MRRTTVLAVVLMASFLAAPHPAASAQQAGAAVIQQVLREQADAWNRGDVEAFMQAYKDAPDTTFIGKSIQRGYVPILDRYKKAYPNKDAMGKLDFSEIEVRNLGPEYAVTTGRFHLARNAAGGGDASGIFSLIWEKTPHGWKIILDHTSVDSPPSSSH